MQFAILLLALSAASAPLYPSGAAVLAPVPTSVPAPEPTVVQNVLVNTQNEVKNQAVSGNTALGDQSNTAVSQTNNADKIVGHESTTFDFSNTFVNKTQTQFSTKNEYHINDRPAAPSEINVKIEQAPSTPQPIQYIQMQSVDAGRSAQPAPVQAAPQQAAAPQLADAQFAANAKSHLTEQDALAMLIKAKETSDMAFAILTKLMSSN